LNDAFSLSKGIGDVKGFLLWIMVTDTVHLIFGKT
jgi:hypothetical protein